MTNFSHLLPALVFPALLLCAAARDVVSFTIPNWISLACLGLFFPCALIGGMSGHDMLIAVAVGAVFLVAGIAMFALGWVGGGDAKLIAAVALWMGWPAVLPFLLFTAVAGGGLAIVLIGGKSLSRYYPVVRSGWALRLLAPESAVPYGLAIAIGALAAFPQSPLLHPTALF
jgi:prepilin peptidase CpaA